ncbi:hypothetical protein D6C13_23340 [Rahnella woolbedingensis]|uniref:Uncharacterized protein n=1 Tax=Rahnella woolbedingensis TaxID=1510574 RepID=A0A419N2N4_9GAMM|nr:hypothetical protein D6C13_23340 [Rahnella woolbedingensis]
MFLKKNAALAFNWINFGSVAVCLRVMSVSGTEQAFVAIRQFEPWPESVSWALINVCQFICLKRKIHRKLRSLFVVGISCTAAQRGIDII